VLRRSLVSFVAVVLLAALAVSAAVAANVRIRVEGRLTTIYGPTQPVHRGPANPLEALEAASAFGEFYYHVAESSFGQYVDQIGRHAASGSTGWVFKVNGVSPPVGADQVVLRDGDVVLWYWAEFGPEGGPPTLELQRRPRNCYQVLAVDDKGVRTPGIGAVVRVDGRRVSTNRAGRACVGRHAGLVSATRLGAVRSNALR
jgi:hypothetical protein